MQEEDREGQISSDELFEGEDIEFATVESGFSITEHVLHFLIFLI